LALTGCAGGTDEVGSIAAFLGSNPSVVKITPVEAYTRVARGAKACWFGPGMPLSEGYIFSAVAQPPSKGGNAEIVIYRREGEGERGLRMFSAVFAPQGEATAFAAKNHRVPAPFGDKMVVDVARWAAGERGCDPISSDWAPSVERAPAAGSSQTST
jgi:hypothetical protein